MRQGLLNIEAAWVTHTWWHRQLQSCSVSLLLMLCWHTISNIALILKLSMSLLMIFLCLLSSMNLMVMLLRMNREGYQVILTQSCQETGSSMSVPSAVPFNAHPLKS